MPEINRLEQRNWTRQEPDPTPITTTIASSAMRGVAHSSPIKPSRVATENGALGRGTSGSLSQPADWPISCWSTSTSKVFLAASASCRVRTAGRGFYSVTSPKCSSQPRGWVHGVRSGWQGSGVCGREACAGGCGHGICLRISSPCSGRTIGWLSTMVSTSSADEFTISPWPIVRCSLPSSSSLSSSSSSSSSS